MSTYVGRSIRSFLFELDFFLSGTLTNLLKGTIVFLGLVIDWWIGIDNLYHSGCRSVTVQYDSLELVVDVVVNTSLSREIDEECLSICWLWFVLDVDSLIGLFSWKIVVANELLRIGGWTFWEKKNWRENFNWNITFRCRLDRRLVIELFDVDRLILILTLSHDDDDDDDDDDDTDEGEPTFVSVIFTSE